MIKIAETSWYNKIKEKRYFGFKLFEIHNLTLIKTTLLLCQSFQKTKHNVELTISIQHRAMYKGRTIFKAFTLYHFAKQVVLQKNLVTILGTDRTL